MQNEYQTTPEPSGKETWYSASINAVTSGSRVNTMNRYLNKVSLVYFDGTKVTEFIKKSQLYPEPSDDDQYYFVDASKRFRPDIIAQEVYGTPLLYWVILSANHLARPLDVKTNMTLRVPSLNTILRNGRLL